MSGPKKRQRTKPEDDRWMRPFGLSPKHPTSPSRIGASESWAYHERGDGILVVTEVRDANGAYIGTVQHTISLARIRERIALEQSR